MMGETYFTLRPLGDVLATLRCQKRVPDSFFCPRGNRLLSGEVKVPGGWARMMIFLPTCAFYVSPPEFLLGFLQSHQEDSSSQMEPILLEGSYQTDSRVPEGVPR